MSRIPSLETAHDSTRTRALRDQLVDHILTQGVTDKRVLAALRDVPRHVFIPEHDLERAYADHPLAIGFDATISQPSLVGLMSQALGLLGDERVLEIGTGSGYQAAILGRLARHVDTVEVVPELGERAADVLRRLGSSNVTVHGGDGWLGWASGAPYERIVVTAAPEVLPLALLDQLADGGLLVVPVGPQTQDQRLERWHKQLDGLNRQDLGAVRFVPMVHA